MAAQLAERPSRIERDPSPENKIERLSVGENTNPINQVTNVANVAGNVFKKPLTINFLAMCGVALVFDVIGFFSNEVPGVGIALEIIADVMFIPWFYFSGIKFNSKRIASMTTTSILEFIPVVGNLPFITLNVIYSYYSE